MNRKIIGVTVGSSLPKPNFKQTDPTKGDYIKNKPDFDGLKNEVLAIGELVGDTKVSEQIANMSSELENKIYRQNDEPLNAEEGALWIDLDDSGSLTNASVTSVNGKTGAVILDAVCYSEQKLNEDQKAQARANIGVREPLEPLMGSTDDITPSQALIALATGRGVGVAYSSEEYGVLSFANFIVAMNGAIIAASCALDMGDGSVRNVSLVGYTADNIWECTVSQLNAAPLIGLADDITPTQVGAAIAEGRSVFIEYRSDDFGGLGFTNFCIAGSGSVVAASCAIAMGDGSILNASLVGYTAGDDWECTISPLSVQKPLIGSAEDTTPAQVSEALLEGRDVVLAYTDSTYGTIYFSAFLKAAAMDTVACSGVQDVFMNDMHMVMRFSLVGFIDDGNWDFYVSPLAEYSDVTGKLDAAKLPEAINTALDQAKASGDFKGEQGEPGLVWKGEWDGDVIYCKGDAVSYNGTSYICTSEPVPTGSPPVEYELAWAILAEKGDSGKIPVKGVDYWTEADQEAIVQQVIAALGTPVFGRVDEDNTIILTGALADGTYIIKYEDADGEVTEIGTLKQSSVSYTNLFVPGTATLNTRMSGSSKAPKTQDGYVMTATIPITATQVTSSPGSAFIAVPAAMWSGSANMFQAMGSATTQGYCDAGNTPGTIVGSWVKIPLVNQWGNAFTCDGVVLSLYVKGSAITASDIQNIEIYYNEIPE